MPLLNGFRSPWTGRLSASWIPFAAPAGSPSHLFPLKFPPPRSPSCPLACRSATLRRNVKTSSASFPERKQRKRMKGAEGKGSDEASPHKWRGISSERTLGELVVGVSGRQSNALWVLGPEVCKPAAQPFIMLLWVHFGQISELHGGRNCIHLKTEHCNIHPLMNKLGRA